MVNLKDYFLNLNSTKKAVFVFTVVSFVFSVFSFALAGKQILASGPGVKKEIVTPNDFFGRANKSQSTQNPSTNSEAKTVPSPLNGVLYTTTEAADWQARRPMAVMVNNHVLARPQTGLSQADIIYEAVAEGGITRFLAVFHSKIPEKVGPVRSAREYYVDFAKENDAWYAHWGGASTDNEANVYNYMRTVYVSSIDGINGGVVAQASFVDASNPTLPTEHTKYFMTPQLYDVAYALYPDQVRPLREIVSSWSFKDDAVDSARPQNQTLSFNFWDLPEFKVDWNYDKATNSYKRSQGGKPHMDKLTNEQLTAKDIIVLYMDERSLNDGKGHLLYKDMGQGTGKAFIDGTETSITWVRSSVNERTRFYVSNGLAVKSAAETELQLNRGQIWIEILPTGSALTVN